MRNRIAMLCAALWLLAGPAAADGGDARAAQGHDIPADVMTDGFMAAHPDLDYRRRGIARDKAGELAAARGEYLRAARYGDKPSQARLGEMYWNGQGTAVDRVQGFLWMALAAERKYREFALLKMYYWQQLTPAEQAQARGRQQAMLDEYGDAAAQRRQALAMRREAGKATGSMLGHSSASALYIVAVDSQARGIDAERFYAPRYWTPGEYWALQDRLWERQFDGKVDVGGVEQVDAPAPAGDGPPR